MKNQLEEKKQQINLATQLVKMILKIDDIACGRNVTIYNKNIRFVSCDAFTRRYFSTPDDPDAMDRLGAEIGAFIAEKEPDAADLPKVSRSRDLSKADFTVQWSQFCAKRKVNPVAYVSDLASGLQGKIESGDMKGLIVKVAGVDESILCFRGRARLYHSGCRRVVTRALGSASW